MDENSWRVIQDPLGDGACNMAKDRAILIACNEGRPQVVESLLCFWFQTKEE